jgi:hypothetical protein
MTETTTRPEARRPEREPGHPAAWFGASAQMGALVQQETEIRPGWGLPPCQFGHHGRGALMPEPCEREARLRVNGIALCSDHGEEAEAGVRAELYQDASDFFERLDAPHVGRIENRAVAWALQVGAVADLNKRCCEADDESREALVRAYPLREDLMDAEARAHDYSQPGPVPEDWFWPHRHLVHRLQRIAHEHGATALAEALEPYRQSTAVQLAYAIQDAERKA